MLHCVCVNIADTTIKKFQFALRKDFQQCLYATKRQNHSAIPENVCYVYRFVNIPMHCIVTSKLCHVTTILNRKQYFFKFWPTLFSVSSYTTHCTKTSVVMALKKFKGQTDYYNGITVDSNEESCTPEVFVKRLTVSLQDWIKDKKRTIWFRVHLPNSEWIPILVKEGFKFHHAQNEYVMLYRWLVSDEECNVPHYAHTNLGVGAFVYNESTNELLVIKEKYVNKVAFWKLPGGFVEPGENLEEAVKREVLEETGIQTTFNCLISFRHAHDFAFNCSDIYAVCYLSPVNFDIKKCNREISECKWMKFNDYVEHSEVHSNNKLLAKKMLEFLNHRMGITVEYLVHPVLKKPVSVYSISKIDNVQSCSVTK
ncbi:nudix hydrolase 7 isoform X1 [Colletes gigas]|uniref:nudix hydrolase 7 isoform X1 n=2 Tax=Colletes gigas TaxID=935657 RepID=UPI001C9B3130|nr:nudix hydrolase 7 isoform X1 [Colletes gigas]